MPTLLKNLKINTIGSVDRPANQNARAVLFKRADDQHTDQDFNFDLGQIANNPEALAKLQQDIQDIIKGMKTEGGVQYPAAAYAYVPDPNQPSTWKLRLWETPEAKETAKQVGMAVAALGEGFRGNKVEIPADALDGVKAKVRAAWLKVNTDKTEADLPDPIKKVVDPDPEEGLVHKILARLSKGPLGQLFNSGAKDYKTVANQVDIEDELWEKTRYLRESIESILVDNAVIDKQTAIQTSLQQYFSDLVAAFSKIEKAGRKIAGSRMEMLNNMKTLLDQLITEASTQPTEPSETNKKGGNEVAKVNMEDLPEEIQKMVSDFPGLVEKAAQADTLKTQLDEALTKVAKLEGDKQHSEFLSKASVIKNLGIKPDELADIYKRINENKATPEDVEKLQGILKAADDTVSQNNLLFKEIGGGGVLEGSAEAHAEELAKQLMEKDSSLTREKALAKVWRDNSALYKRYQSEKRGAK
ncbi:MAG: hypothetical protein A4E56_00142 [Pelotomaculum sp. PtaU1.Bin065]|nr:MAG: hypothetical protein A4E56_00142 [Pelotomaculum sp. PtaU1.Bin065]